MASTEETKSKFQLRVPSIRGRLRLALLLVGAIPLPAALLALVYVGNMETTIHEVTHVETGLIRAADQVEVEILMARRAEKNYLLSGKETTLREARRHLENLVAVAEEAMDIDPLQQHRFRTILRQADNYRRHLDDLGRPGAEPVDRALAGSAEVIAEESGAITRAAYDRMEEHGRQAKHLGDRAERDVATLAMLSFVALVALLVVLPRRLLRPLRRIARLVHRLREGRLQAMDTLAAHDEVGDLARALDQVSGEFRRRDGLKVAKILEMRNLVRAVIGEVREGVVVLDVYDGTVAMMNEPAGEFLDRKPFEVEQKPAADLLGEEVARHVLATAAQGRVPALKQPLCLRDIADRPRPVAARLVGSRDRNGALSRLVLIFPTTAPSVDRVEDMG